MNGQVLRVGGHQVGSAHGAYQAFLPRDRRSWGTGEAVVFPKPLATPEPRQPPPSRAPRTLPGEKGLPICSLETRGSKQPGLSSQPPAAARPRALTIVLVTMPPPRHAAARGCAAELSCKSPATPEPSGRCRPAGARSAARRARSVRRASALAHDACRKSKRSGTRWAPRRKAGVCRSTRGRLLPPSTLGPSRGRAKLSRLGRSRLSFAPARRCFPGGPCADGFRDFRSEVTFSQGLSAHARAGGVDSREGSRAKLMKGDQGKA